MNTAFKPLSWVMLWCVTTAGVAAQESPPAGGSPNGGATAAPETTESSHRSRASGAARSHGAAGQKVPRAADRVDLDTATVTGDREQPKVMYIVPWKKADIGEPGKPMNSLLDEVLEPVDRDEFKREVAYYEAVKAGTAQSGAPNPAPKPAAKQGEK